MTKNNFIVKFVALFVLLGMAFSLAFPCALQANAEQDETVADYYCSVAQKAVAWKKRSLGISTSQGLFDGDNAVLRYAGDWFAFSSARLGLEDDYSSCADALAVEVSRLYERDELLGANATEWHRKILTVAAIGADPTSFGIANGEKIDLVADGVYDSVLAAGPGAQGITGLAFALIALDCGNYQTPSGAKFDRDKLIAAILSWQLDDGGFAFMTDKTDPDVSGMVLQALAPYYFSEKTYSYQTRNGEKTKTVRQVADETLSSLSALQLEGGDYQSWGSRSAESTAQVVMALTALGIDVRQDARFVKNGKTLVDGLNIYANPDGGFGRIDEEGKIGESDDLPTRQALYAFVSLWRKEKGLRAVFDERAELDEQTSANFAALASRVLALDGNDKAAVEQVASDYYAVPLADRRYVGCYDALVAAAKKANVDLQSVESAAVEGDQTRGTNVSLPQTSFTQKDRDYALALPQTTTSSENYAYVSYLFDKLRFFGTEEDKLACQTKLDSARSEAEAIIAAVSSVESQIEKYVVGKKGNALDKDVVESIFAKYSALSDYDKGTVDAVLASELLRAQAEVSSANRTSVVKIVLYCALGVAVAVALIVVVLRNKNYQKQ